MIKTLFRIFLKAENTSLQKPFKKAIKRYPDRLPSSNYRLRDFLGVSPVCGTKPDTRSQRLESDTGGFQWIFPGKLWGL